jgi:hypothetical protein
VKKALYVFMLGLMAVSCRNVYDKERPYKVQSRDEAYFKTLINDDATQTTAAKQIVIANDNYPIELTLYKDKTFRYHLKKLGDGAGTWSYEDGFIKLYAERTLFVMRMEVRSLEGEGEKKFVLEFSDRFGPNYLPVTDKAR